MITQDQLKELLDYDSTTGVFVWKKAVSNNVKIGSIAGSKNGKGCIDISIDNRKHKAHRLAWLYVYGVMPTKHIDHINGIPADNRIENLRDVTRTTNNENRRTPQKNNKTGFLGVSYNQGSYVATLSVNGKNVCIGRFTTPEEAHSEYLSAKRKTHVGCTI